ncbi:hypothetical protein B0H14DRAFT_3163928 [Mycena olivaceomarginata]|nr:hypothetical protein B0H14DRAFT_3163928 [Mycena olivaceomarginata]
MLQQSVPQIATLQWSITGHSALHATRQRLAMAIAHGECQSGFDSLILNHGVTFLPPAGQAGHERRRHRSQSNVHAEDAGFADEEDNHSDPEMGAADEEDEPVEEADDLQGVGADDVERRLADSVKFQMMGLHDKKCQHNLPVVLTFLIVETPWLLSSSNTNDEDSAMLSRPSSRASFSSGHYSVPESNFDPIETTVTSRHERQKPAKMPGVIGAIGTEAGTTSKAGPHQGRTLVRPEWNDPQPSVSRASGQRSRSRHPSITIKHKYAEPVHIKAEPEDSTLTSTGGSDDISLRKNSRGTLNLTKQHPDVQNVLGLAIDYFLDALTRSARDLKLPLLQTRLWEDADYRSGLSTVLFGHISIWHGKVQTAAHQVVYGHYQVQHDCAGLVTRLLDKQSFIYPHNADVRLFLFFAGLVDPPLTQKIDPRTHEVTHGKPDKRRPYEHKGVPAVASCFFKGPNSIAERVEAMFVRNAAGNLEASHSMVALSCTGIFSTVDDYSTGEHKPTDFEGSCVQDVYEVHIMILQKLEAEHPEQYHTMMENYSSSTLPTQPYIKRGSSFAKGTKAPLTLLQEEALYA